MLDDSLDNFFESILSGERYKLYTDIIFYLESIEYSTIQDELLNLMYESIGDEHDKEPKPEATICDEIHAHLQQCLVSQLRLSGVSVEDHVILKDTYDLAIGIQHISAYEDIASIIATAGNDDGPIDQLAEILQLVTTQPSDHWVVMFDSVSPQLLQRIRELSIQTVNSEYQEMEETAEYLFKLRIYAEYVRTNERNLLVFNMVETTILGSEFETYINSGLIDHLFEGNEMDKLALELYGMALMSSDAKNDPPGAIRTIIEKYLSDTTRIVKLNNEVGKVNANFVKFFQTSSKGLTS